MSVARIIGEVVIFAGMSKPGLPSGTRDFGPETMYRRRYVMNAMESVFQLFGFLPLETPALENLSTLTGKYGDEGDQLLFKVLNNGDFLAKVDEDMLSKKDSNGVLPRIADRGLRYDLTVPLARYVVMNRDKVSFPFRRYQMQPVWRADRPQKGRYREFWQCDVDVVGSYSVLNEADLLKIYDEVFEILGLPVSIRINHRMIFDSFEAWLGGEEKLMRFMQLVDKADKIGFDGVMNELSASGIPNGTALWQFLSETAQLHSNHARLDALGAHPHAERGLMEDALNEIRQLLDLVTCKNQVHFDLTLARGLSYYTGVVFEVVPDDAKISTQISIGSIGGGGRYNNLTEYFGVKDVPGVGISFGLDRICDIMESASLFPETVNMGTRVLVCAMDQKAIPVAFSLASELRSGGVATEVYPGAVKLRKQLDYANALKIPFAAILGENELNSNTVALKDLNSGEQHVYPISEIQNHLHLWQL